MVFAILKCQNGRCRGFTKSQENSINVPFIMLTGHGNVSTAVEAMKSGAHDFISKPPDLNRLLTAVRNALQIKNLVLENKNLKKRIAKKYEMIGVSDQINEIHNLVEKVAPTEARVLITGENGTGKELVAHHLHQKSNRSGSPFVEVVCHSFRID